MQQKLTLLWNKRLTILCNKRLTLLCYYSYGISLLLLESIYDVTSSFIELMYFIYTLNINFQLCQFQFMRVNLQMGIVF